MDYIQVKFIDESMHLSIDYNLSILYFNYDLHNTHSED